MKFRVEGTRTRTVVITERNTTVASRGWSRLGINGSRTTDHGPASAGFFLNESYASTYIDRELFFLFFLILTRNQCN